MVIAGGDGESGDGDDDDDVAFDGYDDDDDDDFVDFVSEERREEDAARERREARKRRLHELSSAAHGADDSAGAAVLAGPREAAPATPTPTADDDGIAPTGAATSNKEENGGGVVVDRDGDENDDDRDCDDEDDNDYDMFNATISPLQSEKRQRTQDEQQRQQQQQQQGRDDRNRSNAAAGAATHQNDFDDPEGYYKASIGEVIDLDVGTTGSRDGENDSQTTLTFRVLGIIGKGVFSSVLKCSTVGNIGNGNGIGNGVGSTTATATVKDNVDEIGAADGGPPREVHLAATGTGTTTTPLPPQVALKCIRSNETMAKAAQNEIKFLLRLRASQGIVPLLLPTSANATIEFRGHTVLVFPYEPYNLRDVLVKFGKGVGLSLTAVRSYFGQLLAAATHLRQHHIIHADIKPDNILVSADFGQVLICDFGSAVDATEQAENGQGMITPYLVSRFYRAPEIILGLPSVTYAIDLWSLAVTAAELFLGKVLLQGRNNNDMLFVMMQHLGPFPGRMVRSHLLQAKKHPLPTHFSHVVASNYVFRQETVDPVLGQAVHKEISLANNSMLQPSLQSKLLKARSPKDSRAQVLQFSDLLSKCLVLDPSKRITVKAALQHDFFKE